MRAAYITKFFSHALCMLLTKDCVYHGVTELNAAQQSLFCDKPLTFLWVWTEICRKTKL